MTSITCIGNANMLRAPTISGAKHPCWPDRTEQRSRCCTMQASPRCVDNESQ